MSWDTCVRCDQPLYPRLCRVTDEGWVHSSHFCADCGESIGPRATSGYCRRCYSRRRHAGQPTTTVTYTKPTPCNRCGIPTSRDDGLCRDCRDVLADLGETEAWAA